MVIAATAILIKSSKILLVKRSGYTKAYPNHWAFPGGRANQTESPEESVCREVKEEIGIDFKPTKLFAKGKWKNRQLYRFIGSWKGKVNVQKEEVADFGWFTYEETKKLNLAFDYKEVIEKLHKEYYF